MTVTVDLLLICTLVAVQMVFMTIEGDLKDIKMNEPSIPSILGVEYNSGRLNTTRRFSYTFQILNMTQIILVSPFISRGYSLVLYAVTGLLMIILSGYMVHCGESYSEDLMRKLIVGYTICFVILFCIAAIEFMSIPSVAIILWSTILWGLGWQFVLYGDESYFA
jgi:hypothetical protein